MFDEVELTHLPAGDVDSGVVVFGDQIGADGETGLGLGCYG